MKKETITGILVVWLFFSAFVLYYTAQKDKTRFAVYDCVARMAKQESYTGNPYSQQAWQIFAPACASEK